MNSSEIGHLHDIRVPGNKVPPMVRKQLWDAVVAEQCKDPCGKPSRFQMSPEAIPQGYAEQQDKGRKLQIEYKGERDKRGQRGDGSHAGKVFEKIRYPVKGEYAEKKGAGGSGQEEPRDA